MEKKKRKQTTESLFMYYDWLHISKDQKISMTKIWYISRQIQMADSKGLWNTFQTRRENG